MFLLNMNLYASLCLFVYFFTYIFVCWDLPVSSFFMSASVICVCNRSANSVALAARGFGIMRLPPRASRQPGGDRVRGGLLGHAVVTDHCVETASWVGVLGGIVGLQRGWDTTLVLRETEISNCQRSLVSKMFLQAAKPRRLSKTEYSSFIFSDQNCSCKSRCCSCPYF